MKAPRISPRKQPVQQRAQETVRAVLEAATYILIEQGHEHASTNGIAERAGVNIGSLYQYFPNKQAIFTTLAEQHFRGYTAHMSGTESASLDVPLARSLRLMIHAHVSFCVANQQLARALLRYALSDARSDLVAATRRDLAQMFEAYLATRAKSELRPRDPKHAAHITVLVADAITQDALLSSAPLSEAVLTGQIADVLEPYLIATPRVRAVKGQRLQRPRVKVQSGKS